MKTLLLAVGFSLLLSGCGGAESDARKAILGSLKDPDSAKFGKFTQVNENDACLTVNARNSMGGYTGDQQAKLTNVDKKWLVLGIHEISHDTCISSIRYLEQQKEQIKIQADAQLKRCLEIKDCIEMVMIPPVDMGEPGSTHRVTLKGFALGKTEVTQGQWKAVMGNNPSKFSNCGDTCPVEQVSWNDVQEFIGKLNAKTGKQYRLPTEAEWEYACYGGSQTEYCGGNDLDAVGWYGNSGQPGGNSNQTTHPAGQKQANGYGLYDMSGNVWEWASDRWNGDYAVCGGSWGYNPLGARAAARLHYGAANRYGIIGFRLAKTLP